MFYRKKEKSFFENAVEETKEGFEKIEEKGAKKVLKWYDFGASKFRIELKRRPAQYFFLFMTTFLGSVITSSIALFGFSGNILSFIAPKPVQNVAAVQTSNGAAVSEKYDPLLLATKLRNHEADIEIVDIRPLNEYVAGHIASSINVPVYGTQLVTKDGDLDRQLLEQTFRPFLGTGKLLIIYAQNAYSTLPSDISSQLSSSSKKVKALAIGWEEWLKISR